MNAMVRASSRWGYAAPLCRLWGDQTHLLAVSLSQFDPNSDIVRRDCRGAKCLFTLRTHTREIGPDDDISGKHPILSCLAVVVFH